MSRQRHHVSRHRSHGQDPREGLGVRGGERYAWGRETRGRLDDLIMFPGARGALGGPGLGGMGLGGRRGERLGGMGFEGEGFMGGPRMADRRFGYGMQSQISPMSRMSPISMGNRGQGLVGDPMMDRQRYPYCGRRGLGLGGRELVGLNPGLRGDYLMSGGLSAQGSGLSPGLSPGLGHGVNPSLSPGSSSRRQSLQSLSGGSQYSPIGLDRQPRQYHYRYPYVEEDIDEELLRTEEALMAMELGVVPDDYYGPLFEEEMLDQDHMRRALER